MNLVFASKVPKQCRPALENLLFFNSRQFRVRDGIIESLRQFGHPRLEETADGVSVRVGDLDTQTLFAFDRDSNDNAPVGLVTFLRTSTTDMSILHLAVRSDYSLPGWRAGLGLGLVLIEKVKEIASRIVGVRRIVLQYRQGIVIQI
ncbi:MAG: hypothetical protein ACLQU3_22265 [Limisphaerales bacterium]